MINMPRLPTSLHLLHLLVLLVLLLPLRDAAAAEETIQFRKGEISVTVRGHVSRFTQTYQFRARKDQRITVTLAPDGGDKGQLTFTLYAYCGEEFGKPLISESLRWRDVLPCSDRYAIDVTPGSDAMRAGRTQRYALTLEIE